MTTQSSNAGFARAREAAREIARMDVSGIDGVLIRLADILVENAATIIDANNEDLCKMDPKDPRYDRLRLDRQRIEAIAGDLRNVAAMPSPLGIELEKRTRPNGMVIRKVSVPFGVIGVIYEARPNVTVDVFSLCFKAGSAVILKGGHEAENSNKAIVALIRRALAECNAPLDAVTLIDNDRESTRRLLEAVSEVDLIIPRGSRRLIDFVRDNARVPVIETGAGVCHTYFHSSGDIATGKDIILNAKTRRVSVCNALDCLIIDSARLADLPALCFPLADKNVTIYADAPAFKALQGAYPHLCEAGTEDFGREWLDYKMTVRTADGLDDAIGFIARYGSGHSECIIAENAEAKEKFLRQVDAACVYANVSTAFTDGAQFGMGAEIGISTQKLHARGPMALREITTYKYIITGAGQTRPT